MRDQTGYLLRKRRLAAGLQQKELCRGICSTSYLCKIEQGDAAPGEDVLRLLFARLGVANWQGCAGDPADRALLRRYFTAALADRAATEEAAQLRARAAQLEGTELELYIPLVDAYEAVRDWEREALDAALSQVKPFLPWLSGAGEMLYAHACVCAGRVNTRTEAAQVMRGEERYPCSVSALDVGTVCFAQGSYQEALNWCRTGLDRAVREGCVAQMAQAARLECNSYANLGELTLMLAAAKRAMGLYEGDAAEQGNIAYNIGATLMEFGRDREALEYLLRAYQAPAVSDWERGLTCHKLALLLPRLHRGGEAEGYLREAQESLSPEPGSITARMLEIARMRLQRGFLDDPAYAAALESFCRDASGQLPHGYVQFHERMLEESLVQRRRYKEAYQLVKKREQLRDAPSEPEG